MNRNQLYSKIIAILICNQITIFPNDMRDFLHYGKSVTNKALDIFVYKGHYSLYFINKNITIRKYVK